MERVFTLKRVTSNLHGTFGVLIDDVYSARWVTLEDVWLGNSTAISCIPKGQYVCKRHVSSRFGETFWLQDVPNRSGIIFHGGNKAGEVGKRDGDTRGCILLGKSYGDFGQTSGIQSSQVAYKQFLNELSSEDSFILNVEG